MVYKKKQFFFEAIPIGQNFKIVFIVTSVDLVKFSLEHSTSTALKWCPDPRLNTFRGKRAKAF